MRGIAYRVREALDFFLPPACAGCRVVLPTEWADQAVCHQCRSRLRPPPRPRCPRCDLPLGTGRRPEDPCGECSHWPAALAGARAAFTMQAPADTLVHGLKYEGWWTLADFMAKRLAELRPPDGGAASSNDPPLVVPIPTTRERIRSRGYNQAELLARAYAEHRGLPLWTGLLRTGQGRTQVSLHPLERRANVIDAFRVADGEGLMGREVLLIDDVLTTGATAGAASAELVRSGAASVVLLAFGRALPRREREGL